MTDHIANAIRMAVRKTDHAPSDAAKQAGNYAKGKFNWRGETIAIENPKGSMRSGTDKDGKRWECRLAATYGYLLGTRAVDGDHVDCYVGDAHDSPNVWVVDQVDLKTKRYDEPKCMLDFPSKEAAIEAYTKAFSDGRGKDRIGSVTEMSVPEFKEWANSSAAKKPLAKGYATGGAVSMPLIKGGSRQAVSSNIKSELAAGKKQTQAVAIALSTARRYAKKASGGRAAYDEGGAVTPSFHDKYVKPLGSAYPREPWAWTKDYPGLARFLSEGIPQALMGLPASRVGAVKGNDAVISAAKELKALHDPGPYDWGVTGGNPDAVGAYLARSEGRSPTAIWERSSDDLGTRLGTQRQPSASSWPNPRSNLAEPMNDLAPLPDPIQGPMPRWSLGRPSDYESFMARGHLPWRRGEAANDPRANGGSVPGLWSGGDPDSIAPELTRDILPPRPRHPAGDYLERFEAQKALREANPTRPGDFNLGRGLANAFDLPAEMTGVPSVLRGLTEVGRGHTVEGGIEAATGALPVLGPAYRGAKAIASAAKPYALPAISGIAGLTALTGEAGSQASPMQQMISDKSELMKQRSAAQADLEAQTKGTAKDKDGKPIPAGRGPRYDAAAKRVADIDTQLAETNAMIRAEQKRAAAETDRQNKEFELQTPEARLAADRQQKAFEAEQAAKERGKPVREHLGPFQDAVMPAATLAGYLMTRKIAGNANAEYARALDRFMTGQKTGNVADMALAQSQLAKLEKPSLGQKAKTAAAALLPAEARLAEASIDLSKDPETRAYQEANKRLHDPASLGWDVGTSLLSSATGYGLGSKTAKPYVDRSLGRAIAESPNPYAGAEPLAAGYGSALRLSEDLGRLRQSPAGASSLPPTALASETSPALMAPARSLAEVRPAAVERALEMTQAQRQLPPPGGPPSLSAPAASSASEKPVVIIRSAGGTHHMADNGHFAAKELYSKESKAKAKSLGKGKEADAPKQGNKSGTPEKETVPGADKPERLPDEDWLKGRKVGGVVSRALDIARSYALGGAVRVGAMPGATGGRDDKLPVSVPAGSYILPADAVSGWPGAGNNTAAGFKLIESQFGKSQRPAHAQGGAADILISDGEYILGPDQVAKIGGGSLEKGHAMLDAVVHKVRADHVKALSALPGPAR